MTLSGRIEGDDSAVAPKTGGRILEIRVREGDSVQAGEMITILDDQQVRAREDQARAMVSEAEAKAKSGARSDCRPSGAVAAESIAGGTGEN